MADGINPYKTSSKQFNLNKLWSLIVQNEHEIQNELGECRMQGRRTKRYDSLASDMKKLKAEYEKVKGLGTFDPTNQAHHDRMERQNILGRGLGKVGEDTHLGVAGDADKR